MADVREQIALTQEEEQLFSLLLEAAKAAGTGTTLRCAGGWVRDKLLGKDSKDIDVALDNMLGREFADKVGTPRERAEAWDVCILQSSGKR
jgi:tRNA nucleotidyltransferase/poly(A) polymerase